MKPRIQKPLFQCEGCMEEADALIFMDADEIGPVRTRCPRCRDAELELARIRRATAAEARRRKLTPMEERRTAYLVAGVVLLALLAFVLVLWIGGALR